MVNLRTDENILKPQRKNAAKFLDEQIKRYLNNTINNKLPEQKNLKIKFLKK